MYLREFGVYILKYVVAAVVGCGMCGRHWTFRTCKLASEVTSTVESADNAWLHQCSIALASDAMQNAYSVKIYIVQFGRRCAFPLHFVAVALYTTLKQVTTPTPRTTTIITFKAVSENVGKCILFLSVEKRIKRVYVF